MRVHQRLFFHFKFYLDKRLLASTSHPNQASDSGHQGPDRDAGWFRNRVNCSVERGCLGSATRMRDGRVQRQPVVEIRTIVAAILLFGKDV